MSAAAGLAAASAIHVLWATGSSWPRSTPDELADLVVGRRPMPGPAPCAVVALALAAASGATAWAAVGRPGRPTDLSRALAMVASAALLVRGVGGAAVDIAEIGTSTPEFHRWNRLLYNPLCVVLGVLSAVGRARTEP